MRLTQDQADRKMLEDSTSISLMPNESQSLQARNANFMWFLLYIEVLLKIRHPENVKDELIEICKKLYADKPDELSNIDQFQREYASDKAIFWYTKDTCFYRMLNKALRLRDFDMLFALRFFIADLANELKGEHEQQIRMSTNLDTFVVYRGQLVNSDELQLMQNNVGEFISMNSFLSTSRTCKAALSFLQNSTAENNNRRILFEITINPRSITKAFADIKERSSFPTEDEILIMLGALFRIDEISEKPQEKRYTVKLSLASDDQYRLKGIFDFMKSKIGNESTLDSLGKILQEMGEHQHALKCYDRMMHETQIILSNCHMGIGRAMYGISSYDNALKHYEASLIIRKEELGKDNAEVGISYSRVGAALCRQGEIRKSLINLQEGKEIQERVLPLNSLELAETYNSLGLVYFTLNELKQATTYFEKTLEIRSKVLPPEHSDIGFAYNNLGRVLENDQQYGRALIYLKKALAISLNTLTRSHPDVERLQENILRVTKMKIEQEPLPATNDESDYSSVMCLGMD
jgi:tetratricopeptide (TPR) repeat protein